MHRPLTCLHLGLTLEQRKWGQSRGSNNVRFESPGTFLLVNTQCRIIQRDGVCLSNQLDSRSAWDARVCLSLDKAELLQHKMPGCLRSILHLQILPPCDFMF